jgi:pimeloyl-ACP methyl ester carboxylesterase
VVIGVEKIIKTKKKFRFWIVLRNILLGIVAALVLWFIFSNLMTTYEQKKYPAIGQLVEVDGKSMHVYTKNNKVVVVESFGYGWSDITDKERTVENMVEETRTALKKLNIKGPYILMPHSISGIYSMYYANRYPEEIKAIIGIDPTLPEWFGEHTHTMPKYLSYLAPTGIARLVLYLTPDNFLPIAEKGTYTEENQRMTKAISAWKGYNKNVVNEMNEINNNIDKTIDMTFPSDIPVMIFSTKEEIVNEDGQSKINFYKTQIQNIDVSKLVTIEGHHYLHRTHYKEMSEHVNEFTERFK